MGARRSLTTRVVGRADTSDAGWIRWLISRARVAYRFVGRTVPALHLGWVSQASQVGWDGDALRIQGWGYTRGTGFDNPPKIEVWLSRRFSPRIVAEVSSVSGNQVIVAARQAEFDYGNTAFEATWDAAALGRISRPGAWQVRVQISGGGRRFWGPIRSLSPFGSGSTMGPRRQDDGTLLGPVWRERRGLVVVRHRPAVTVVGVKVNGRTLTVALDKPVNSLALVSETQQPATFARTVDDTTFTAELPDRMPASDPRSGRLIPASWSLETRHRGRARPIHLLGEGVAARPDSTVIVRGDREGRLEILDVPVVVRVDSVELERDEVVRLEGQILGDPRDLTLWLAGSRSALPVELTVEADRFVGRARLRLSTWGGPELPPVTGPYSLHARSGEESLPTFVSDELARQMPSAHLVTEYQVRFQLDRRDQFRLYVGPPRRPSELGSFNQRRLQRSHNAGATPQDAVFFESFFGRNATCNPRAIDAEIARRYPDLPRFWSVRDLSIAVPDGALPVVAGTTEWWRARTSSRWVVTNEWLRPNFRKQPFQTVLQTWHGSMYKKIGLDRANMSRRHYRLLREERAKWDMFISQNAPGTEIIKSAYEFGDEDVIESGYPRNDELQATGDEQRAAIRARLGIADGVRVVMYAPTWRLPDVEGKDADFVDLPQLVRDLGPGWVLLLRGHVRTLGLSDAIEDDGILDVGTYPQVSELFMVADALITDYSSMMFDYSVTGKPMIFFAPDIDEYSDDAVRGAYFDLEALAPGPVVRTQAEVRDLLLAPELGWHDGFAGKYADWVKMFNHRDDGLASRRATDALFRSSVPQRTEG